MASVGYNIVDGYDKWHNLTPTEAVTGRPGEWVDFADGRLRLQSLTEVEDLTDGTGQPVDLPASVRVWRAVIEIDAPVDASLEACDIELQDVRGDTYAADPDELADADIEPFYGCLRPFDGPETGPFTVTATFITPRVAVKGIRVTVGTELPRYAWLTPPA
ncbi:MAG: hypothetical protein IRY85_13955 [Micromonosporaceae bacterium]|nr:hypothetical protein [Micromonosporaceae bacterium]